MGEARTPPVLCGGSDGGGSGYGGSGGGREKIDGLRSGARNTLNNFNEDSNGQAFDESDDADDNDSDDDQETAGDDCEGGKFDAMEEGFGGKATNRYDKLAPLTSVDQHNNDVKVLLKQLTSLSHPMAFQASDGVSWEVVVVASSVLVDSSKACDLSRDRCLVKPFSCSAVLSCYLSLLFFYYCYSFFFICFPVFMFSCSQYACVCIFSSTCSIFFI